MSDTKFSKELQLPVNSPENEDSREAVLEETDKNVTESSKLNVIKEPVKNDGEVLTPSGGGQLDCSAGERDGDATRSSCQNTSVLDEKLRPIEQQLQYLLNKAMEFQAHLMQSYVFSRRDHLQNEGFSRVVPTFLRTCQPYFTYLESTARSALPQRNPLPMYIRSQLLDFSQQLCACLEQLILMYANYNVLSLEESEPESISHFSIGHCQIDSVKLYIFRYCQPSPYLAGVQTGLYKRMRWNVVRPCQSKETEGERGEGEVGGERDRGETEGETASEKGSAVTTEYYFLCYQDVPEEHTEADGEREPVAPGNMVRLWSIGHWVQTQPDPETDDISDWILCVAPQAQYRKLLCLGGKEPSACSATDCLLGVLLSQQGHQESVGPERASP